jgi:hypothetical protein
MLRRMIKAGMFDSGVSDPYAGYSYYVNSVTGSDDNAGTSSLAPFATITKLLTVWQAGQSVGLAKGSTWREEMTVPGASCTIAAYGLTGNKPILDASDIAAKGSITKTPAQTNVYQISVTPEWQAGKSWVNAWEDDVYLTRAASVAACDATAGSYFPSSDSGTITLYIHASDSSDVSANAKVYTYTKRLTGMEFYAYASCIVSGIRTQKNLHEDGSMRVGRSATLTSCDVYYGSKHNILVRDGCQLTNVTGSMFYYGGTSNTVFVYNEDAPASLGVTFTNCSANNGGTYVSVSTGYYGHNNVSGDFGTVTFTGCNGADLGVVFSGTHATFAINNTGTYSNVGAFVRPLMTTTVTGGTFTGPLAGTLKRPVDMSTVNTTLTLDGVTFAGTLDPANAQVFISATGCTLNLVDCVFAPTTPGTTPNYWMIYCNVAATVNAGGVDFNQNDHAFGTYVYYAPSGVTLNSDLNTFHGNTKCLFAIGGTTYNTVALYQAGTGQDANSTIV